MELEAFIKHSDHGGYSKEYNNVAADLERLNRIVENEGEDSGACVTQLRRLRKSCEKYLKSRSKSSWSTSRKIRRSLVEAVFIKVDAQLFEQTNGLAGRSKAAYETMDTEKHDLF